MKSLFLAVSLFAYLCGGSAYADRTFTVKPHLHHAKGLKRHHERHMMMLQRTRHVSYLSDSTAIPGNADISAKVSLPENQGQCGSCWAFSLTKALRSSWMTAGKDPGVLDFNYLTSNFASRCFHMPGAVDEYGCQGGDFNAADNFKKPYGPGLAANDPYYQREIGCPNPPLPVAASTITTTMLGDSNGPSFKDLAMVVGVKSLVPSIDVAAGSGQWENYDNGIYNECSGGERNIDHMINLVGYSCETSVDESGNCVFDAAGNTKNGDGYLVVMNNWGEGWGTKAANGHGGYMKTRYMVDGYRCNAIATTALVFNVL